ncbi:hypothetical protein Fleli_0019 [Bernardetia litoralis DSM 6794]|uniref:Lipocalin-like domain-containing protein n=1 Tax=Bernardetia litoralis (strain ATCC 23117 / DSM 6794 / NBRC 15988 / NCIMB 1366 / Fx l1 / Sio-4) TaxID=880071 RepID=I4AEZ6_BERLS|nr:hypothetical protein [Bernardetia litoralis]AFM02531.1 hypothetical protein Fleli_0019 [Bernardetia litoralis DSM 6794]
MKNTLLIFVLTFAFFAFTSDSSVPKGDQFRVDYNHVAIYNKETKKWSDWIRADHTFVFNYNLRNDVMHMKANGDNFVYKKMTEVEDGKNDIGQEYQAFSALDEEGLRFTLLLYHDKKVGLMMIYSDVKIQFTYF